MELIKFILFPFGAAFSVYGFLLDVLLLFCSPHIGILLILSAIVVYKRLQVRRPEFDS